jgi:hypothetical protein
MRLAVDEVRPHEHHSRAGSCRQQDEPRRITVNLIGREIRPEHMRDEDPGQQSHREGFHQPVDAERGRNPLPVRADGPERRQIDLEQHRNDHQPNQHRHRQIDVRDFRCAEQMKNTRYQMAESNADHDAERDSERQIALEYSHRRRFDGRDRGCNGFTHCLGLDGSEAAA